MTQSQIDQTIQKALDHHQAGQLAEAELLYRQVLAQQPAHVDAIHLLGVLAYQSGKNDVAVKLIRNAIALRPNFADAYNNLGRALRVAGDLDGAITAYRNAIAMKAGFSEAHNNLGIALMDNQRLDEAIVAFRNAINFNPTNAAAHSNLGNALRITGQLDEAIMACRRAITLKPDLFEAHNNLGIALGDKGIADDALAAFQRCIALNPGSPEAYNNFGIALAGKGLFDQAIRAYRRAIALKSNYAEAFCNLGDALLKNGQIEDAIASHRHAIQLKPDFAGAHNNLGYALSDMHRFDEAVASYRRAIHLQPDFAGTHYNLGCMLLLKGDYQNGWHENEWRFKCKDFPGIRRSFRQPMWDGGELAGRTILLYADQGFGDTIQFVRYLPMVVRQGGRIILECQAKLIRLLRQLPGVEQWIVTGQSLPPFDVHCPLMSLPLVFGTKIETIPTTTRYLDADNELSEKWATRLVASDEMRVGIVWSGNPNHTKDCYRSLSLSQLAPLAHVAGIKFYSLQKGKAADQASTPPKGMELIDHSAELDDFADTAALIANLDLVITVDTAVAHLAGAMGKPVWTLLPFLPDWRWLLDREDSPWYPSMRLFRQPRRSDWDSVIARVVDALSLWVRNRP